MKSHAILTLHRRRSIRQLPIEKSTQQHSRGEERQHLKDARGRIAQDGNEDPPADDAELVEEPRGISADVLGGEGGREERRREEGREEMRNR